MIRKLNFFKFFVLVFISGISASAFGDTIVCRQAEQNSQEDQYVFSTLTIEYNLVGAIGDGPNLDARLVGSYTIDATHWIDRGTVDGRITPTEMFGGVVDLDLVSQNPNIGRIRFLTFRVEDITEINYDSGTSVLVTCDGLPAFQ